MDTNPRPPIGTWRASDRRVVEAVEDLKVGNSGTKLCNLEAVPISRRVRFSESKGNMDAQLGRRSISMRPQLMDTIVVLIWLSLISICSSKDVNLLSAKGRNLTGTSASTNSPTSPKPAQPPPSPPRSSLSSPTANGRTPNHPPSPQSPSPPPPAHHKSGKGDGNPSAKSPLGKKRRSNNGGSGSAEGKKNSLGKKLGIWFLGIAGCLQVAAVAFLSFKRRQIPAILEKSGTQLGD